MTSVNIKINASIIRYMTMAALRLAAEQGNKVAIAKHA